MWHVVPVVSQLMMTVDAETARHSCKNRRVPRFTHGHGAFTPLRQQANVSGMAQAIHTVGETPQGIRDISLPRRDGVIPRCRHRSIVSACQKTVSRIPCQSCRCNCEGLNRRAGLMHQMQYQPHGLMPHLPDHEALQLHVDVASAIQRREAGTAHAAMSRIVEQSTEEMGHIWSIHHTGPTAGSSRKKEPIGGT